MQSGSQPNKEITGVAGNSHEGGTGEEDEDDENGTEEEELSKMLASGISMKTIQKKIGEESKQEKSRQKTLGKGRGRGGGRAKTNKWRWKLQHGICASDFSIKRLR